MANVVARTHTIFATISHVDLVKEGWPRVVVVSQTCAVVVVFGENAGSKQRFFLLVVA